MAEEEEAQTLVKEEAKSEGKEKKVYVRVLRTHGYDWYELDLEQVEGQSERGAAAIEINNPIPILETAPVTPRRSAGLAVDSKTFYVLGGRCWGRCGEPPPPSWYPRPCRHVFADVFRFEHNANADGKGKGGEWRKLDGCPMSVARLAPSVFAHQGMIYVFGGASGKGQFGEVFDPNKNTWTYLTDPPPPLNSFGDSLMHLMVLDSSRHRILVATTHSIPVHAYDLLQDSWSCPDSNFRGRFSRGKAVVMDDVLYCVENDFVYAYDLVKCKRLSVHWSSYPSLYAAGIFDHPEWSSILPLDRAKGRMCLADFSPCWLPKERRMLILHFLKFTVQRVSDDKLHMTADAPIISFTIDGGIRVEEFITLDN